MAQNVPDHSFAKPASYCRFGVFYGARRYFCFVRHLRIRQSGSVASFMMGTGAHHVHAVRLPRVNLRNGNRAL